MHRNKEEKDRDKLIGEAVLILLKTHGYVDSGVLVGRLKAMADEEQDQVRKKALVNASEWILKKIAGPIPPQYYRPKTNEQNSIKCLIDPVDNSFQKKH